MSKQFNNRRNGIIQGAKATRATAQPKWADFARRQRQGAAVPRPVAYNRTSGR